MSTGTAAAPVRGSQLRQHGEQGDRGDGNPRGAVATSRSAVADDEAASLRALLGVVAGAAGITVSAIALFPILAQL